MNIPTVNYQVLAKGNSDKSYNAEVACLAGACSEWGFAYLANMQRQELFSKMLEYSNSFFKLPEEEKRLLATTRSEPANKNRYRGYFPLNPGSNSYKEGFESGFQDYVLTGSGYIFDESSVWPDADPAPGFRMFCRSYFQEMYEIGRIVLSAFEHHFKLPGGYFTEKFGNTLSTLRSLHYPALEKCEDRSSLEFDQGTFFTTPSHTDSGIITLLLQDGNGGLQVRNKEHGWTDASVIEDALVMNVGDLLERWTGGEFKATVHRLKAPTQSRYSVPFFLEPEGKALIEPFKESSSFPPVTYEEYLSKKFAEFVEYQDAPA